MQAINKHKETIMEKQEEENLLAPLKSNMENEIKQLLKSTDREDIKLGIILAIKELGIEWCKREFISPTENTGIGYTLNYIMPPIAIKLKGEKECIYAHVFIEYSDNMILDGEFDKEDYYEYTDYTD